MMTPVIYRRARYLRSRRGLGVLVALTVGAAALSTPQPALPAAPSGLVVMPHTASAQGLSYFKLSAVPGSTVRAGTIELRNPTSKRLRVMLAAVDGETLSTLGSSYAPPGSR